MPVSSQPLLTKNFLIYWHSFQPGGLFAVQTALAIEHLLMSGCETLEK